MFEQLLRCPLLSDHAVLHEDDPVGDYGAGVKTVYKMFSEVGMQDVSLRLYPNDRHELLNESDREQIFQDIWQWIYSHII